MASEPQMSGTFLGSTNLRDSTLQVQTDDSDEIDSYWLYSLGLHNDSQTSLCGYSLQL